MQMVDQRGSPGVESADRDHGRGPGPRLQRRPGPQVVSTPPMSGGSAPGARKPLDRSPVAAEDHDGLADPSPADTI